MVRTSLLWGAQAMTGRVRCAIYTRKSSEEGLEQSFNSLDAQREACEAYILSQRHEGWQIVIQPYDDGGFSGGNMERPGLKKLLEDISCRKGRSVVVYKVDRLTRSLADFAKIVERSKDRSVSFVSVTQQFNTTTSMGRLTLNVLLSFAQFEREVTGERIRDKIAASKRKGMWMGGVVPMGYDLEDRHLVVNPEEARRVKEIYEAYLAEGCVSNLQIYLEKEWHPKQEEAEQAGQCLGQTVCSPEEHSIFCCRIAFILARSRTREHPILASRPAIIDDALWDRVQMQLKDNIQGDRTRGRSTSVSLLRGLLYDENGNLFTPSHTRKAGRRYRYYTSRALIRPGANKASGPMRLPADEIEELVLTQISNLFSQLRAF